MLKTREAPWGQTVRVVREVTGQVLVWEPRRWVREVPYPPEQDGRDEDGAW